MDANSERHGAAGITLRLTRLSPMARRFLEEVSSLGLSPGPGPGAPVRGEDIAKLPESVRRYLIFMGVMGRPRDWSFRLHYEGRFKSFGPKVIYTGLNLAIEQGEASRSSAAQGVGKSVMLKMLIGLLKPDRGDIVFDGKSIVGMKPAELARVRQRIGMVFQGAALFDSLSVRENVAYGLREHFHMNESEISERVDWALSLVGLPGVEAMNPADLSGGMRKRVGLARTIALRPEVLLYDEPTTGLDPINTTRINNVIVSLKAALSVTSVVVTHDEM
jgi:phospholipid/cholesterol/gamma-HCH transport system ATP-binding protein